MVTRNGKQPLKAAGDGAVLLPTDEGDGGMALYVHWPFCVHKCPYCDFNSHVARVFDEADYVAAIRAELDHMAGQTDRRPVGSIFFGGGTPSLMAPASVAAIIAHIRKRFEVAPDAEITLEANPSSSEAAKFAGLREAGVDRLSLGVQALDDEALRRLERPHDLTQALAAIAMARRTFPRVSFDLIYARPGQTAAAWREELRRALDLAGGHISAYSLTLEAGTRFHALHERGALAVPQEAEAERLFDLTRETCLAAGLPAYEISNYAAPGEECRHNLAYWRYRPYLGVGPGAHGRVPRAGGRWASATLRSPARWIEQVRRDGHGLETFEALSQAEMADEMLLMGMRLTAGVDLAALAAVTGYRIGAERMAELAELGLVTRTADGRFLAATAEGVKLLNPLIERLSRGLVGCDD
jgi:oxygen-independent coproporphyrinogen-3 oxidase